MRATEFILKLASIQARIQKKETKGYSSIHAMAAQTRGVGQGAHPTRKFFNRSNILPIRKFAKVTTILYFLLVETPRLDLSENLSFTPSPPIEESHAKPTITWLIWDKPLAATEQKVRAPLVMRLGFWIAQSGKTHFISVYIGKTFQRRYKTYGVHERTSRHFYSLVSLLSLRKIQQRKTGNFRLGIETKFTRISSWPNMGHKKSSQNFDFG